MYINEYFKMPPTYNNKLINLNMYIVHDNIITHKLVVHKKLYLLQVFHV